MLTCRCKGSSWKKNWWPYVLVRWCRQKEHGGREQKDRRMIMIVILVWIKAILILFWWKKTRSSLRSLCACWGAAKNSNSSPTVVRPSESLSMAVLTTKPRPRSTKKILRSTLLPHFSSWQPPILSKVVCSSTKNRKASNFSLRVYKKSKTISKVWVK